MLLKFSENNSQDRRLLDFLNYSQTMVCCYRVNLILELFTLRNYILKNDVINILIAQPLPDKEKQER